MRRFAAKAAGILLLAELAGPVAAEANRLTALHVADKADRARLVFEFAATPEYRLTRWAEPGRLLVDLPDAELGIGVRQPPPSHPFLGQIRVTPGKARKGLLFAVDLKRTVIHRVFTAAGRNGVRLVIELIDSGPGGSPARPKPGETPVRIHSRMRKAHVVAIDAGHGGKDTGAIGPGSHREKDIVLSIARRLRAMIRAEPGLKPVLVRRDDRFVPLRERLTIARAAEADLFLSLHADADPSGLVRGMSVFTLSDRGASSEAARWLARKENAAALAGGVSLRDKDRALAQVLLDLSQKATLEESARAASALLREIRRTFPMHRPEVQRAGFVVLKSPDIPSVLVETGFISNPVGEKKLSDPAYQEKIARTLFCGIRRFFADKLRKGIHPRLAVRDSHPPRVSAEGKAQFAEAGDPVRHP
jgi:N-acetylmuramoyl-L-alanine amidase